MPVILIGPLAPDSRSQVLLALDGMGADHEPRMLVGASDLQACLDKNRGDVLLLDMDLLVSEGFLACLARNQAAIPVVGMGKGASPDVTGFESRFPRCYFPLMTFLAKPVDVTALAQAVSAELQHLASGVIEGLSLPSLLQMLNVERKTCTLRVHSGRRVGYLFMQGGTLINARFRQMEGMDAAIRLLASGTGRAEILSQLHDSARHIEACLEEVLMQAMCFKDEETDPRGGAEPPSEDLLPEQPAPFLEAESTRGHRGLLWSGLAAACILAVAALGLLHWRPVVLPVASDPPGALLSLDGRLLGKAPLVIKTRRPLKGMLRAELPGYRPLERSLESAVEGKPLHLEALPAPHPPSEPTPAPVPREAPPTGTVELRPAAPRLHASRRPRRQPPPPKAPPASRRKQGDVFDQVR
nr:DUF4388 domain-containing protein [uncultured Holophaga sp.]